MINKFTPSLVTPLLIGVLVGGLATNIFLSNYEHDIHDDSHGEGEYHVHADFLMIVNDEVIELDDDKYMSTAEKILSPNVHMHDNNGKVIHYHAPEVTLVTFLNSIGINLSNKCLTIDKTEYCTDETNSLALYVNGEKLNNDKIESYISSDDDSILLYYGNQGNVKIPNYLNEVTNDACLYSGTCPERGTAPPESCGLFCIL